MRRIVHQKMAIVSVGMLALGSIALTTSASATTTKTPGCGTVKTSVVKSALGGSPKGPKSVSGICEYGTVSIAYVQQTLADMQSTLSANKATVVTGLGSYAYTAKISMPKGTLLAVLDNGYEIIITSPKATLAQEENLANKIISLV